MVEDFYANLEEAKKLAKKGIITVVLGDSNAKNGAGIDGVIGGGFGLGERNTRGDRLVQKFCITTLLPNHPPDVYTLGALLPMPMEIL